MYLQRIRAGDDEDLRSVLRESVNRPSDWYWAPQSYRPGPRTDDHICQINANVIDLDRPELDDALDALAQAGVKPHCIVQTNFARYQLLVKLGPIPVGKRNRQRVLRLFREVAQRLADVAGGDLNAAKPGQAFRLPGSRRVTPYGIFTVSIIEQSDHAPYNLFDLVKRVKAPKRVSSFLKTEKLDNQVGTTLQSPALRWIVEQRIADGSRDNATVGLAYAYDLDGKSAEAQDAIEHWAISHLDGHYSLRKVRSDVASCLRNPKGLSPAILDSIQNIHGETMGLDVARSVYKHMPRCRQRHERKPIDELRYRPLFEQLSKVLRILLDLQKANRGRPVFISAEELATKAHVPLGTLNCRVIRILESLNVYTCQGRGFLASYDLRECSRNVFNYYAFIELGLFTRRAARVVQYWRWRFAELWQAFERLVEQIASAFQAKPKGVYADNASTCEPREESPRLRGPPLALRPVVAV